MDDLEFDHAPLDMIRRVGSDTLVNRMIELFLSTAPGRVEQVLSAHAGGDPAGAGRAGDGVGVGALLPELSAQLASAEAWLRSVRSAPSSPEE